MTNFILILQAFILGAFLVYLTIPVIVKVSKAKNLFDVPDERKVNKTVVPNLGGIALFIGISLASFLSLYDLSFPALRYIMAAVIVMFFVGIKDDILTISPRMKFLAQIIAALLLIVPGDMRFTNLHGVLGMHEINYFASVCFSMLAVLAITNAVNLIDGIDGLASSIGIIASVAFGSLFYLGGHVQFAVVSFATAGSLIVFFNFNVFGKQNKMFMGDTGSLIIGILISIFVIQYNEFALTDTLMPPAFSPTLSLAIISLPLFDMVRVFFVRIIRGQSPFHPDMNHIHHKLLSLGYSHMKSTLILVTVNLFFIGAVFLMQGMNVNYQLLVLSALFTLFTFIPNFFIAAKRKHSGTVIEEQPFFTIGILKRDTPNK